MGSCKSGVAWVYNYYFPVKNVTVRSADLECQLQQNFNLAKFVINEKYIYYRSNLGKAACAGNCLILLLEALNST